MRERFAIEQLVQSIIDTTITPNFRAESFDRRVFVH